MLTPTSLRAVKICLLLLALLGVFVKGLIPIGFMPEFSRQAGTAMVICSGIEQKTIYVDESGKPTTNTEHQAKAPCDFASTPTLAPPVFERTISLVALSQLNLTLPHDSIILRTAFTTPPITGPPTFL